MNAAVVLLGHGLGEDLAWRARELAVEAAVLTFVVPLALSAAEVPATCGWRALAAAPPLAAPLLTAPFAAGVLPGVTVGLAVVLGEDEPEVGVVVPVVGDGDDDPGVGLGELLVRGLVGLETRPSGLGVFLQPGGLAELCGWLDDGTGDAEPSCFG